ncbi:MAG: polysulfide reductase NrfD [Acidobacteria bacterium]|nr:polysulfide reductase NrfD [Acidobacteriota bacterium]
MEVKFEKVEGGSIMFYLWSSLLAFLVLGGVYAAGLMHTHGMFLSGLTNRIPWGIQVVLAGFYIGMSVGCMIIAALCESIRNTAYRSFSRIAVFLALLFSIAAFLSVIADQGRIGHALIRSFTHFNSTSLFSISRILNFTLCLLCCIFLYALLTGKEKLAKIISLIGVLWAVVLYSATGYIYGLYPRELYGALLAPPIFIAAAAASGIAAFILVTVAVFKLTQREPDDRPLHRTGRILGIVVIVSLCLVAIENVFRLSNCESLHAALFFLFGGFHSMLFWVGGILIGGIAPVYILLRKNAQTPRIVLASALVIFGVLCQRWLLVLPGLMFPPDPLPGWEIVAESGIAPEGVVGYSASFVELAQALGIFGLVGLLFLWGVKFLKLVPREAKM